MTAGFEFWRAVDSHMLYKWERKPQFYAEIGGITTYIWIILSIKEIMEHTKENNWQSQVSPMSDLNPVLMLTSQWHTHGVDSN